MAENQSSNGNGKLGWIRTLFYDVDAARLSRTAVMNFIFFALAVFTWIILLVILLWDYARDGKIDSTFVTILTGYATAITGGGFLQYSYGKKINSNGNGKTNGNGNGSSDISPVPTE